MVEKIVEESTETVIEMTVMIEAGTVLEKGHFPEIMAILEVEGQAIVGPDQDPRASTNRDRIWCYMCRKYNHFTRDCSTSRDEKEIKQLQQILNL